MEVLQHLINKISQSLIEINDMSDRLIKIRNDKTITYAQKCIQSKQIEEEIELFLELILSNEQLIYKIQAEETLKSQELKKNSSDNIIRNDAEINNNDNHLITIEKENPSVYENTQYPITSCKTKNQSSDNTIVSIDTCNSNELKLDKDISMAGSSTIYNKEEMTGCELPDIKKYILCNNQLLNENSSSEGEEEENDENDENFGYDFTNKEKPDNGTHEAIRDSNFNLAKESEYEVCDDQEYDSESSSYGDEEYLDKFTLLESLKNIQSEKIPKIYSTKPPLNPIFVQPGSSIIFINYFRKIMKNNMSKIFTDDQTTEIRVDWIPRVKEENIPLQIDLLNDLCKINTTLLSDVIQDIFDLMEGMYLKNEPMHKYAIEQNIPITECLMIPRASRNNRNIYFLFYELLMCNNKKSFIEIYEKFEKLIIKELINPIFLDTQETNISKLSDQPYILNRPCSLEQRYEKMGIFNDSADKFGLEKYRNEIIIQTMLAEECQNEDIAWDHFHEEELKLYEESTGNTSSTLFKEGNEGGVKESDKNDSATSSVE